MVFWERHGSSPAVVEGTSLVGMVPGCSSPYTSSLAEGTVHSSRWTRTPGSPAVSENILEDAHSGGMGPGEGCSSPATVEGTSPGGTAGTGPDADDRCGVLLHRAASEGLVGAHAQCDAQPGCAVSVELAAAAAGSWRGAQPGRAAARRQDPVQRCDPRRRRTTSTDVDKGEGVVGTSPAGRGDRTVLESSFSVCDISHSTSDRRSRGPSLSQWVAQHSVSDTAYRAAFEPCVRLPGPRLLL